MFFVLPFFFEVPFVVVICLHCFDLSSEQGKIKCHQLGHHFFFKWTCSHVNSPSLFFLLFMSFFVILTMFVVVINFCKLFFYIFFLFARHGKKVPSSCTIMKHHQLHVLHLQQWLHATHHHPPSPPRGYVTTCCPPFFGCN